MTVSGCLPASAACTWFAGTLLPPAVCARGQENGRKKSASVAPALRLVWRGVLTITVRRSLHATFYAPASACAVSCCRFPTLCKISPISPQDVSVWRRTNERCLVFFIGLLTARLPYLPDAFLPRLPPLFTWRGACTSSATCWAHRGQRRTGVLSSGL